MAELCEATAAVTPPMRYAESSATLLCGLKNHHFGLHYDRFDQVWWTTDRQPGWQRDITSESLAYKRRHRRG